MTISGKSPVDIYLLHEHNGKTKIYILTMINQIFKIAYNRINTVW